MLERWHYLNLASGPRPALVLDVSESARPYWPVFKSLTEGVLESLSPAAWPRIFFLGSGQAWDAAKFTAQGDQWFDANAGRGSFISPVFEALQGDGDIAVAVVGSGRIFDLPDWEGHRLAEKATWCKFGTAQMTLGKYPEESLASEQLAEKLNNPPVRIEVGGGSGVMPIWWDDPAFEFRDGRLVGEKLAGSLRFGVRTPEEGRVSAAVVFSDGHRRTLTLEGGNEPVWPAWHKLPHAEFTLLRQCLRKSFYVCPACQGEHSARAWRCMATPDRPLFPTLEALGSGGFALIDSGAWETRVRHHACAALQLNPQTVAVRRSDGRADVYRYDPQADEWKTAETFDAFYWMDDNLHAMVL